MKEMTIKKDFNEPLGLLDIQKEFEVIKQISPKIYHGDSISKIASNYFYVFSDAKIELLANDFSRFEEIYAVSVLNREFQVLGIIVRRDLFKHLGMRYGRDLYKFKTVSEIIENVVSFNGNMNIYSVAKSLDTFLWSSEIHYFLISNNENKFEGIFSSKDLLMYLSQITQRDIALATNIQAKIVKEVVNIENRINCEIVGASYMAKEIGGDYFELKRYNKTNWFIMLCDVSGKGISASLITTIISGMLSIYDYQKGLKQFIISINQYMYNTFETEKFITGIFMDYNEVSGEIEFFDLGHSYFYCHTKDGIIKVNSNTDNFPIGIVPDLNPTSTSYKLEAGNTLVLFSDGIVEQTNTDDEEYSTKRLFDVLNNNKHKKLIFIKEDIFADILNFRKQQPQYDDMTIIMLKQRKRNYIF